MVIIEIPPPSGRRNDKAHRAFVPADEGTDGIHLQDGFIFTFRPASSSGCFIFRMASWVSCAMNCLVVRRNTLYEEILFKTATHLRYSDSAPRLSTLNQGEDMFAFLAKTAKFAVVFTLVATFLVPQDVLAQNHVVNSKELQQQAVAASQERQAKVDRVQKFFSTEMAQKALKSAKIDQQQVKTAVSQLSDEELENIAAKTDKAQQDFAAGSLTNQQITYILIALATAVIVILIVKA